MQRWDPWSDIVSLREAMNSLLEDSFVRARGGTPRMGGSLAVDVKEKEDAYEIRASVPGVKPEDVDVSVLGDTVRIRGQFESGSDIAALRRFVRLSQTQFAKAMGISVHTLRNWEQDRRKPDGPALALLRVAARHPRILRENLESAA